MARGRHRAIVTIVLAVAFATGGNLVAAGPRQTTPVVVHVDQTGFRLADAAVGALAGIGLSLAVTGCLVLVRMHRAETNHPKGDTP